MVADGEVCAGCEGCEGECGVGDCDCASEGGGAEAGGGGGGYDWDTEEGVVRTYGLQRLAIESDVPSARRVSTILDSGQNIVCASEIKFDISDKDVWAGI